MMGTALNIWHYIVFGVVFFIFVGGVVASLKQKKSNMRLSMLFSTTLISVFLLFFSIFVVDKYTKKVEYYKLKNKRLLSLEKIVYTGVVKNVGNYPIGKVVLQIRLVNRGHATGTVKGSNFYRPSGFFDFIASAVGGNDKKSRPQSIEKEFVVARNLKPGRTAHFRVMFPYPPYFSATAQFVKVYGH